VADHLAIVMAVNQNGTYSPSNSNPLGAGPVRAFVTPPGLALPGSRLVAYRNQVHVAEWGSDGSLWGGPIGYRGNVRGLPDRTTASGAVLAGSAELSAASTPGGI
jgi:hypothetical protein